MALMRWRPLGMVPRRWGPQHWEWPSPEDMWGSRWLPDMDVMQKNGDLVAKVELPALKPDEVNIDLEEGRLTISGEHSEEKETKEEDYYSRERSFGSFRRVIPIPGGVKEEDIFANLKDGILEVTVKGGAAEISEKKSIPIKEE